MSMSAEYARYNIINHHISLDCALLADASAAKELRETYTGDKNVVDKATIRDTNKGIRIMPFLLSIHRAVAILFGCAPQEERDHEPNGEKPSELPRGYRCRW